MIGRLVYVITAQEMFNRSYEISCRTENQREMYPTSRIRPYTAIYGDDMQTLNGRLPLEQSSHSHETLAKHGSDDSRRFIFRRRKKIIGEFFGSKNHFFADFVGFWGELRQNGRQQQLVRQILL